jgi:hypothetical protein
MYSTIMLGNLGPARRTGNEPDGAFEETKRDLGRSFFFQGRELRTAIA